MDAGLAVVSVADELKHGLPTRRLGTVTKRVQIVGHASQQPLSVFLDSGVVPRADRADNHNQLGSDLAKYQLVQPGDLVFNRLRTWQGGFGASRHRGIVSPAYIVARPSEGDARYLDYVLHSAPYLAELTRISKWMPPSQFDVLWADLRSVEVPWRSAEEQRRIADFLDDRVVRIDQIITARRQQVGDLRERWSTELDDVLDRIRETTRASRLVKVLPGFAFPSADFTSQESDRRLLRGVNVGVGKTRWDEVAYWSEDRVDEVRAFLLGTGDVVIGMDRPWIGRGLRIARITESDGEPLLLQRVAKISSTSVSESFLFWAYQSRRFRAQVESELTGLSVPHLSGDQIGSFDLPVCSDQRQADVVAALEVGSSQTKKGIAMLDASIRLLQEYKQSLITAAVTGELDVTTAGRTASQ